MPSSCSASSSPITPFPAMTCSSSTGWTKNPSRPGIRAVLHRLPPGVPRDRDRAPAEALDRVELGARRVVGSDDRGPHAELPGDPADPLGHVPCARRPHAVAPLGRVGLPDGARRAAELERPDRLQALELEPDLAGSVDLEPHERAGQHGAGGGAARPLDRVEPDQNGTSTPMPRSRARPTQSEAAARSSTASPSDLKSVSSSSDRRPSCEPTSSSPSSATMWSGPIPRSATAAR